MPSYDAHPMAVLTSAFAYLGSYYSEANPSLQGTPETRLTLREWAVSCCTMCYVRILRPNAVHKGRPSIARQYGQADIPTDWEGHDLSRVSSLSFRLSYTKYNHIFLRMAYRVRQGREFVTPPTGLSYTGSYVRFACPEYSLF